YVNPVSPNRPSFGRSIEKGPADGEAFKLHSSAPVRNNPASSAALERDALGFEVRTHLGIELGAEVELVELDDLRQLLVDLEVAGRELLADRRGIERHQLLQLIAAEMLRVDAGELVEQVATAVLVVVDDVGHRLGGLTAQLRLQLEHLGQ